MQTQDTRYFCLAATIEAALIPWPLLAAKYGWAVEQHPGKEALVEMLWAEYWQAWMNQKQLELFAERS